MIHNNHFAEVQSAVSPGAVVIETPFYFLPFSMLKLP
jgi:hypothetical protein